MVVIRNVFQLKFGNAREAVALVKEAFGGLLNYCTRAA